MFSAWISTVHWTGWRPLHRMTAAGKMMKMTLLNRWYPALAVPSYIMLCKSAWLNTRTGEPARTRFRVSKTAWWIPEMPGNNSYWNSSQHPQSLHPAELHTVTGVCSGCTSSLKLVNMEGLFENAVQIGSSNAVPMWCSNKIREFFRYSVNVITDSYSSLLQIKADSVTNPKKVSVDCSARN